MKPVDIWKKLQYEGEQNEEKGNYTCINSMYGASWQWGGCNGCQGDSGDKITLNWQSYDSYDKYQKVVEAFEKENPDIEINFEEVSDYATKILTEATAGDLPDLINCNTGTTQILANAGALQKFDVDALKADTEYKFDDFWDVAERYCTYDGDWYSLPLDGGNYGWVYNVDMLDKCGIEVPEDGFIWDEFTDACKH